MEKYIFNFKINETDYRNSMICMTFGIQKWKRVAILVAWVIFASALILNLFKVIHLSNVIYTCSLLVTIIVGTVFLTTQINILKYKKVYKAGKNISRQIAVDEKGFTFKNRSKEESGFNSWDEITRVQELEEYFIIGVGARDAIILPKRAIKNELESFKELLARKLQNRFMPL